MQHGANTAMPQEDTPMSSDIDKPNPARMYDYFLDGTHNFEADRQAAERIIAMYPDAKLSTQANRAFLRRAVTFLCEQGIMQFIDIGSGIPTAGNVHEIAQSLHPDAHVVYVDIDPVAVAYGQHLLADSENTITIEGDIRQPDEILNHADVRRLIDFTQPVGVLMVALLHFVLNDNEARQAVQQIYRALPAGSYVVISHITHEYLAPDVRAKSEAIYARSTNPSKLRSREEIADMLSGLELIEPGLVLVPLWRPDGPNDALLDRPEAAMFLGSVGRKHSRSIDVLVPIAGAVARWNVERSTFNLRTFNSGRMPISMSNDPLAQVRRIYP
jgi:SAM-dependent methyltransferase